MKKVIFLALITLVSIQGFSQNEKYVKGMEKLLAVMDTTSSFDKLVELSNSFERIGDAEKTQWLPYYYAAYTRASAGYVSMRNGKPSAEIIDPIAAKAEELINKADGLNKDNSEIYVVKKLILTMHLLGDVMNRYMTDGPAAGEALETAMKLNPENPRVYLQMGLDKINTPEQFGGSKEEGKKLLQTAETKYASFKPESSIAPNWGLRMVKSSLEGLK